MNRWRTGMVLLVLAAAVGCGRDPHGPGTVPAREDFIEANVVLREIDREDAEADSLRAAALSERGLTEEQLREFVLALSDRPAELAMVWGEIHQRLASRRAEAESQDPDLDLELEVGVEHGDDDVVQETAVPEAGPAPNPPLRRGGRPALRAM